MTNPIIHAFKFDNKGGGKELFDTKTASERIHNEQLAWFHLY